MTFDSFYNGKKVLVTGDTGFKGSWLSNWLLRLGAEVYGFGLEPYTEKSLFEILEIEKRTNHSYLDIREADGVNNYINEIKPDVIIHLAAQAIVRLSYEHPIQTLQTNFLGTANLLDAVRRANYSAEKRCIIVTITSDKCYENKENKSSYHEDSPMGGHDIYSSSKGAAEILISSWRRSFFSEPDSEQMKVLVASCRAGNVIGGGDWSPYRILVDSVKSLIKNEPIEIRNPESIRPWQHVLEPLSGYLSLGSLLGKHNLNEFDYCTGWNFGPNADSEKTVRELCDKIVNCWGSGSYIESTKINAPHEARYLNLSIDKAKRHMNWYPAWNFDETVKNTVDWYKFGDKCDYNSEEMISFTDKQINKYLQSAIEKRLDWAIN